MMIITSGVGETILIGESIKLKILSIRSKQIRLSVCAPRHVYVHREEIFRKIQRDRISKKAKENPFAIIKQK